MRRLLWLLLGLSLLSGSILSTHLARTMGWWGLLVVIPAYIGACYAIIRSSFPPPRPDLEDAPAGIEGKIEKFATSRATLLMALAIVAGFAPIWVWIVPLFFAQSFYRAHRLPGGIPENISTEMRNSVKYLGVTAVNLVFFAMTLVLSGLTALISFGILYKW